MHIIVLLLGMIIGLSVGTNVSWYLGIPIMGVSLLALEMGGKKAAAWREQQEGLFLLIGLGCGAVILAVNVLAG
jgi:hypothetical protein